MKIKLNHSEYWILLEALRSYLKFNDQNKSITECWTGLATLTNAKNVIKKGYMDWVYKKPYRSLGWLHLTEKGSKIILKWIEEGYTNLEFLKVYDWDFPSKNGLLPDQIVEIDL